LAVQVDVDRAGQMTGLVHRAAGRAAELVTDVQEHRRGAPGQLAREFGSGDDGIHGTHPCVAVTTYRRRVPTLRMTQLRPDVTSPKRVGNIKTGILPRERAVDGAAGARTRSPGASICSRPPPVPHLPHMVGP